MDPTDDPRPRPGGRARRADPAGRTCRATSRAISRMSHLQGHLPGDLQDVAVQQEEPRQAVVADEPQLLVQAVQGLAARGVVGVAAPCLVRAYPRQRGVGVLPGVARGEVGEAVAQVAGQVELGHLGQPHGAGHGLGVVAQPVGHLGRGAQHRLAVAAAYLLRCIQREAVAYRHQGILQERPARGVGVHVAGGHHGHAHVGGQVLQRACQCQVAPKPGALDLHPGATGAEDAHQRAQRLFGIPATPRGQRTGHQPVPGAPRQAGEALVMQREGVQGHHWLPRASVARIARM